MCPKGVDEMANSVDPQQTAPKEQSVLDLHCLLSPICPIIKKYHDNVSLLSDGNISKSGLIELLMSPSFYGFIYHQRTASVCFLNAIVKTALLKILNERE